MLERLLKRTRGESGQGIIAIIVSLAIFVVSAILLYQTFDIARDINAQADRIEDNALSINTSASSIAQLVRTEAILESILATSEPLVPSLDEIIGVAESIDGTATSINSTILGINSNSRNIGSEINRILGTTRTISADITQINNLLDPTISALDSIDGDLALTAISLHSANVSVCGIGAVALGVLVDSQPDETCL